jgi:hypothetical protein
MSESKPIHLGRKNRLEIDTTYVVISKLADDPLESADQPVTSIVCAGIVRSREPDAEEAGENDVVAFLGEPVAKTVQVPDNRISKVTGLDERIIATIAHGSFAMKVLRAVNPSIGLNVLVHGLSPVSILIAQVVELSGANVFIEPANNQPPITWKPVIGKSIHLIEDGFAIPPQGFDKVIVCSDIDDFCSKIEHGAIHVIDHQVFIIAPLTDRAKLPRTVNDRLSIVLLSGLDTGLQDDNYMSGNQYPYGYVRWEFKRNLDEYIRLCKAGKIALDTFEVDTVTIQAFRELDALIAEACPGSLTLVKLELQ